MLKELPNQANEVTTNHEFNLFASENLIHITKISNLEKILTEGLYSPAALARRIGKTVHPGFWFPNDNLVVKFLKLESEDRQENFWSLFDHIGRVRRGFRRFNPNEHAIGFIVQSGEAKRLMKGESYFGIDDIVPSKDICGIVLPILPMLIKDANHFASSGNRDAAQRIINAVDCAQRQQTIPEKFALVDHFGRQLPM